MRKFWEKSLEKKQSSGPVRLPDPDAQDLELYWSPKMAEVLDTWGEKHVWREIQLLMWDRSGKVLDIACGTGKTMELLNRFPELKVYGCDISDLLIRKAKDRGIDESHLQVADATKMTVYAANEFTDCYSIGSLEHFTEHGIEAFILESSRVTSERGLHMIPVSRTNKDEGWVKTVQSFYNNSKDWWHEKFARHYNNVEIIPSGWEDAISVGVWVICDDQKQGSNS